MPVGFSEKISDIVSGDGNPMYGRKHTTQTKRMISVKNRGNKSKTGQRYGEDMKKKLRESTIRRIQSQGTVLAYNSIACDFMDTNLAEYNFTHARNSTSEYEFRGYLADGYNKIKNIWFEYDEPYHFDKFGNLKRKDIVRMIEIMKYLGCRFLRYDERNDVLREYCLTSDGNGVILIS